MSQPLVVPDSKVPVADLALHRALRSITGINGVRVRDEPGGVVIELTGGGSKAANQFYAVDSFFLAVITAVSTADATFTKYAWEEVRVLFENENGIPTQVEKTGGEPPHRSGTSTELIAWNLGQLTALTVGTPVTAKNERGSDAVVGDIVLMLELRAGLGEMVTSDQVKYVFLNTRVAAGPVVVLVKKTSGGAGDDTTDCAFAYSIYDTADVSLVTALATGLTPVRPRYPKVTYTAPADGTLGLAIKVSGTWYLLEAYKEFPTTLNCG